MTLKVSLKMSFEICSDFPLQIIIRFAFITYNSIPNDVAFPHVNCAVI